MFSACFVIVTLAFLRKSKPKPERIGDLEEHGGLPGILPRDWKVIIHHHVPAAAKMPKAERADLYRLTMKFMTEKTFVGRDGIEVDEGMAVIIACQACLLLLRRPTSFYPTLNTIYIYPSLFSIEGADPGHYVGASYRKGPILLAWDHAAHGAIHPFDGHNVVLHEFAHQLDQESGLYDGVPVMEDPKLYAEWTRVMTEGRVKLAEQIKRGTATVINPYGATSSEEFFAVATESFYETPGPLKLVFPDVYDELRLFYCVDPVMWGAVGV